MRTVQTWRFTILTRLSSLLVSYWPGAVRVRDDVDLHISSSTVTSPIWAATSSVSKR